MFLANFLMLLMSYGFEHAIVTRINKTCWTWFLYVATKVHRQRAKKVVSDSPGLVDFAILFLTCPKGKWCILRNLNNKRTVQSILLVGKLLGLVEMKSGLVNASFSLPEWQAVKMIFLAPW